jgi:hypothetical protein
MGRIRRLLPSPAMVVAVIALVMSLTGGAYALVITGKSIKNGTVMSKDIHNHSLTGSDMRGDSVGGGAIKESSLGIVPASYLAGGASRWAVVNGSGQAVRGRDVASVARTSEGRYQVLFSGNVRGCGYYATSGDFSAAAPPVNSQVSVSALGSNVNGVAIRTMNNAGNQADRAFHLLVMC